MLTVPAAPSAGAPSKPMRNNVSTGTPVAARAGRREPDGTAMSGEPVTVTVRGFTRPGPDGGGGGGGAERRGRPHRARDRRRPRRRPTTGGRCVGRCRGTAGAAGRRARRCRPCRRPPRHFRAFPRRSPTHRRARRRRRARAFRRCRSPAPLPVATSGCFDGGLSTTGRRNWRRPAQRQRARKRPAEVRAAIRFEAEVRFMDDPSRSPDEDTKDAQTLPTAARDSYGGFVARPRCRSRRVPTAARVGQRTAPTEFHPIARRRRSAR